MIDLYAVKVSEEEPKLALYYTSYNSEVVADETGFVNIQLEVMKVTDKDFYHTDIYASAVPELIEDACRNRGNVIDIGNINDISIQLRRASAKVAHSGRRRFGTKVIAAEKYRAVLSDKNDLYKFSEDPFEVSYDPTISGIFMCNMGNIRSTNLCWEGSLFYKELGGGLVRLYTGPKKGIQESMGFSQYVYLE
jgi:hypothetical protein